MDVNHRPSFFWDAAGLRSATAAITEKASPVTVASIIRRILFARLHRPPGIFFDNCSVHSRGRVRQMELHSWYVQFLTQLQPGEKRR